jgi:hypothetical protein
MAGFEFDSTKLATHDLKKDGRETNRMLKLAI